MQAIVAAPMRPERSRPAPLPGAARLPGRARGGRLLPAAFQALSRFPALAATRERLIAACSDRSASSADVATIVESDAAVALAVMRAANSQRSLPPAQDAPAAVEQLGRDAVRQLAERLPSFDFFGRAGAWGAAPQSFRRHALGAQRAVDRIAAEIDRRDRDRLLVAALLHDVGKLALILAYPGYPARFGPESTPGCRVRRERDELGFDHAVLGGLLFRRWRLPASMALAVERHHHEDATGDAAVLQLADALAHYEQGAPVEPEQMIGAARKVGIGPAELRRIMCDLPNAARRSRGGEPCPLSARELAALRGLARGLVYKQIGQELEVSTSTVRSHLHTVYQKLGAADRAQAVLIATRAGWI